MLTHPWLDHAALTPPLPKGSTHQTLHFEADCIEGLDLVHGNAEPSKTHQTLH